jgi:hypothetical protein
MSKFKREEMPEQKKYASGIKGIEKKNSFSVPEGYFENLSSRLQVNVHREKESPQLQHVIKHIFRSRLALAASFIGLILIVYSGIKYTLGDQSTSKTPAIEIADVINYQINDIDDNMIYDLYAETSLENSGQEGSSDEKILNAMVEYLLFTDVDIQLIAKEL